MQAHLKLKKYKLFIVLENKLNRIKNIKFRNFVIIFF